MSDRRPTALSVKAPLTAMPINTKQLEEELQKHQNLIITKMEELLGIKPEVFGQKSKTFEEMAAERGVVVLTREDLQNLAGWFHFPTFTRAQLMQAARLASTVMLKEGDQPLLTFTISPNDKERLRSRCPYRDDPAKFEQWFQERISKAIKGICDGSIY